MTAPTLFLIGDDPAVCDSLTALANAAGLQVEAFQSLQAFLDAVPPGRCGCLVVDADRRHPSRREPPALLTDVCVTIPVIIIIASGDIPMAVRGLKAGALDIVEKPCTHKKLLDSISKALAANAVTSR